MSDRLIITTTPGQAQPAPAGRDLLPAALDNALGATDAREAWLSANAAGAAAHREHAAASREWADTHPERDYGDRDAWLAARNVAVRSLEEAARALTAPAKAALIAYDKTQTSGMAKGGRAAFCAAWLDADRRARESLAILDAALEEREGLSRYVPQSDGSAQPNTGSWVRSVHIRSKDLGARTQRDEMRVVVMVAPRNQVSALVAEMSAK
ncbi:hypothetical protein V6K52_10065 [Knoellia sp. S7-12]|uniref:hypothetical protein n=1 Tax=Knoellia sp. S7-12 TaxID=3126698 RepID=UPI003365CD4A